MGFANIQTLRLRHPLIQLGQPLLANPAIRRRESVPDPEGDVDSVQQIRAAYK